MLASTMSVVQSANCTGRSNFPASGYTKARANATTAAGTGGTGSEQPPVPLAEHFSLNQAPDRQTKVANPPDEPGARQTNTRPS